MQRNENKKVMKVYRYKQLIRQLPFFFQDKTYLYETLNALVNRMINY